ncbi:MAG: hypothetical protein KOO62_02020 [candidate division Zixibacteria bacterium]|nr:hypothetical protein [candidate division Zixibacteria bacterium]
MQLAKTYNVGSYYPLFVLTNANGDVIFRWTGYTGAKRFIASINQALTDLTTVKQRKDRFHANPNTRDGLSLASYSKGIGEFLNAIQYYQQIEKLSGRDYSMQIFESSANAVWGDLLPFDSAISRANVILNAKVRNNRNIEKVARLMGNIARKLNKTDRIEKYIRAGLKVTTGSKEVKTINAHSSFLADSALYLAADTTSAIRLGKLSLGEGWSTKPGKYYSFGLWCFQRRINLVEAESFVRRALALTEPGFFRAKHHDLLAELAFTLGRPGEALAQAELALLEQPVSEFYEKQVKRFREAVGKR